MKLHKLFLATALAAMAFAAASAKNVTITVSQIKGDLTAQLRARLSGLTHTDHVVIDFDKNGTYTLNGTIVCNANVEIKGKSAKKTKIVLNNGTDSPSFRAFTDDAFIRVAGTRQHPVAVSIHDISFSIKSHSGIWWEKAEKLAVKIYHANPLSIERVNSYLENAKCTNFDLRVCSNVTVKNCNITNYNNCSTGGNLWIRGETRNVTIEGNTFRKYGNDEILAFFGTTVDARTDARSNITREHITVDGNQFIYGGYSNSNGTLFNDMLITMFSHESVEKLTTGCTNSDVQFTNNSFEINDLARRTINIVASDNDHYNGVTIEGNDFVNNNLYSRQRYLHQDIVISDASASRGTFTIEGNTVTNDCPVVTEWGSSGYYFLLVRGANVLMERNSITDRASKSALTKEALGVNLIWAGEQGGKVWLNSNSVQGMRMLATVSEGNGIKSFAIDAQDNYFEGDTRIYCNNVQNLDLNFENNTFESNNYCFFLQEFAQQGSLVFRGNKVHAKAGGELMTHWGKNSLSSMRFNRLDISGNSFEGVTENAALKTIKKVPRSK